MAAMEKIVAEELGPYLQEVVRSHESITVSVDGEMV
jgi:hypothetical protein